jgi:photosystem II stability/assembly factor-like uncharacterized protein
VNQARRVVFLALFAAATVADVRSSVAQPIPENAYQELRWRMIGPFRGGRTRAAAGVPGQPNVFYIGVVNGGVWRTDDSGRTWAPLFDGQPTQSIGDIAIAPSDPNVVYVASGEGLRRPDLSIGDGIYRSADAGRTWTHLGLRDGQAIPAIRVDPRDPNRVFAAVLGHPYGPNEERGIFRSTDGGQTWKKVLYKDENTGGCDVEIDPRDPDVIYAGLWESRLGPWEDGNEYGGAGGGLYKSTDGGDTWRPLTKGLPADLAQIDVAIAPSRPSRLYASVSTTEPTVYATGRGTGFFRSDDGGESWVRITTDPRPTMKIGGGDLAVPVVDPTNPDLVYACSIVAHKSTDGGRTWQSWRGAPGGDDYQDMWINPNDPRIILLTADQGAIVTENGGRTWSSWYNQPTAQLYHAIADRSFPYRVCSGQQESGSVCISSRGNDGEITVREWRPVGVIEYGYAAPDPFDPNVVYGAGRNEVSRFHSDTGQVRNVTPIPVRDGTYRTERTEPIAFSPIDPHRLYYAANVLFRTMDGGETWAVISPDLSRPEPGVPPSVGDMAAKDPKARKQRGAIYSLAPSFRKVSTLWAGTDDGFVWITRDEGGSWTNVTPPGLAPWSKVTQISASPFDDDTAYVSVSRFRVDDLRPLVFRTHDGGRTWASITSGIPDDEPVNAVRADPVRAGLLFAGTEKAVYVSFDDGDYWQSLQLNLPRSSMRDLWIEDVDLVVATHGRSFWILDDISPLRQLNPEVARSRVHLFAPAKAYRVMRSTYPDTPVPPDEPMGQNPPAGAVVDYFLGGESTGPVTVEILDPTGVVVRRYRSDDPPEPSAEEVRSQLVPPYWVRPPRHPGTGAGMHRVVWDLHQTAPFSATYSYPISAVPHDTPRVPQGVRVLPGRYTVRLSVDGQTTSEPLTVVMDPRVGASPAALRQEFDLLSRLSSLLTEGSRALRQARSVREQLESRQRGAGSSVVAAMESRPPSGSMAVQRATDPRSSEGSGGSPNASALEQPGQVGRCGHIVRETELRPPVWDARIGHESAVAQVEDAMCRQCNHDQPERRSKARDRGGNEDRANQRLKHERMGGISHDCKERVVGRDDNRHDRIEGAVAIQADAGGKQAHRECQRRSDYQCHATPPCRS